jgi:hypothetical protein
VSFPPSRCQPHPRALKAAGIKEYRLEFGVDGKFAVVVRHGGKEESINPWDVVLKGSKDESPS